jgi:hypothetical protein
MPPAGENWLISCIRRIIPEKSWKRNRDHGSNGLTGCNIRFFQSCRQGGKPISRALGRARILSKSGLFFYFWAAAGKGSAEGTYR